VYIARGLGSDKSASRMNLTVIARRTVQPGLTTLITQSATTEKGTYALPEVTDPIETVGCALML
jgi:hypothetical protein